MNWEKPEWTDERWTDVSDVHNAYEAAEKIEQRDAELSCRDVFAASPHAIECIGPALVEEASAPHIGFWKV